MTENNQAMERAKKMPVYIHKASEHWGKEKVRLIMDTIGKELEPNELGLFLEVARVKGLDPFSRQIHAVKRYDSRLGRKVMTIQTGIDGFRVIAERTGKYRGQRGPFWCGQDGVWKDVWLSQKPPAAAKVGVIRSDFDEPIFGVALFQEYAQTKKGGGLNQMWSKFPSVMLAKCAESIALRKSFPDEIGGLYSNEEMEQAQGAAMAVGDAERATQEAKKAVEPLPDLPPEDDVVDADFEESPPEQEAKVSNTRPAGTSATRTLLRFVDALDSCKELSQIDDVVKNWKEELDKLPRGKQYIDAYIEHTKWKLEGGGERELDSDVIALIDGIEKMKEAAKAAAA